MSMYVPIQYEQFTNEEHLYRLRALVAMSLTYIDGDSFKTLLMAQDDDYLLKLINHLKVEGVM